MVSGVRGITGGCDDGVELVLNQNGRDNGYEEFQNQAEGGQIRGDAPLGRHLVDPLSGLVDPVNRVEGDKEAKQQLVCRIPALFPSDIVCIAGDTVNPDVLPDSEGKDQQQDVVDQADVAIAAGRAIGGCAVIGSAIIASAVVCRAVGVVIVRLPSESVGINHPYGCQEGCRNSRDISQQRTNNEID